MRLRPTNSLVAMTAVLSVLTACGSDAAPAATTLTPIRTTAVPTTARPPATTVRVSTTIAATTTTRPATTTTASTSTTTSTTSTTVAPSTAVPVTTAPPGAALVLRNDGLGSALFGADPDQVVAYLTSVLGKPTADSGFGSPFSAFGTCPGTTVRGVTWGDLTVLFSDSSWVRTDRRHFFAYTYGPPFAASIQPAGPAMAGGVTIGSPVGMLRAAFPTAVINPGDDVVAPNFIVDAHLSGFISGTAAGDTVTAIDGGVGCGE